MVHINTGVKKMTKCIFSIAIGVWSILGVSSALAQSDPRFVPLGDGAIGALYVPDSGPVPYRIPGYSS